jgi:hypothetical protein
MSLVPLAPFLDFARNDKPSLHLELALSRVTAANLVRDS